VTAIQSKTCFGNAFEGSLVADALSMPVHWYYNREALDRDYGPVNRFFAPKHPHPDSILWRSAYEPSRPDLNILHDQAPYWGQKGVHYHQFLNPGENTLNYRLASELYSWVVKRRSYDAHAWLEHYIEVMCTPGWHNDTYVEEVHRTFFQNLGRGFEPWECGVNDLHIGALVPVPALLAALAEVMPDREKLWESIVLKHVALTHRHPYAATAARQLVRLLMRMARHGASVSEALCELDHDPFPLASFEQWRGRPDREVIGQILTPACYLPDAMTAAVYLAWKYQDCPAVGLQANAEVGGDNCHRGAVVGSLLSLHAGPPEFD
jgi:ADP-ribosyl-[dinitrogen reductase] hydrolase